MIPRLPIKEQEEAKQDQTASKLSKLKTKEEIIYKRRIELKCKRLTKGKLLVLLKDMSLYRELEKHRIKNRLKTLFYASIAHELLTPINIINGMNEDALNLAPTDFLELKDKLLKNKMTIQKLQYLADDVIDMSKYEMKELWLYKT